MTDKVTKLFVMKVGEVEIIKSFALWLKAQSPTNSHVTNSAALGLIIRQWAEMNQHTQADAANKCEPEA